MKIINDFIAGLKLLFSPGELHNRVTQLNNTNGQDAFFILLTNYLKKVNDIANTFPNDVVLQEKVKQARECFEEEDLKSLIQIKKEIEERGIQRCETCQKNYKFSCPHEEK